MPKGFQKGHPSYSTDESRRKISQSLKGKNNWIKGVKWSEERKRKHSIMAKNKGIGKWMQGKHLSEGAKKKLRNRTGCKSPVWKGGISPLYKRIRRSIDFRLWRESVFARDNWTCQKCNKRGVYLHPHHISNFAQYPYLRFAIDNGITFCKDCHNLFHKIYGKRNNNKEQIDEFLCKKKS